MESIAFFGKGGIGKSTISSNVSAVLASMGRRVLHVGCDPKMDSTLSLAGRPVPPYSSVSGSGGARLEELIVRSPVAGVSCVEAGGPEPGVGCAGVAIGALLEALRAEAARPGGGDYDAYVYDVLGDVVCGGFAAPLKRGASDKAVIVTSEEPLSLYAANNLLRMINNYSRNGVFLAGLAVNLRDPSGLPAVERFAEAAGVRILGVTLRDPDVAKAERERRPAVLAYSGGDFSRRLVKLCLAIRSARRPASAPRPLSDEDFAALFGPARGARRGKTAAPAAAPARRFSATDLRSAGFAFSGLKDGALLLSWRSAAGTMTVEVDSADRARGDSFRFSDWAACVDPASAAGVNLDEHAGALKEALGKMSRASFRDLLDLFAGEKDPYEAIYSLAGRPCRKPHSVPFPDTHLGRWHRFAFPVLNDSGYCLPPGALLDYADDECRFNDATRGGGLGFYDLPRGRPLSVPRLPAAGIRYANTCFGMEDALRGDDASLRRRLSDAAETEKDGGLIELHIGCSPLMINSDLEEMVSGISARTGARISVENVYRTGEGEAERDAGRLAAMVRELRRGRGPVSDVCLVDYGAGAGELARLLSERGVTSSVLGTVLSGEAARARLRLLADPGSMKARAFTAAGLRWIAPPLPYGFSAADAWLRAAGKALGRKLPGASSAEKREAAALKKSLARVRAGFIVGEEDLERLACGDKDFPAALTLPFLSWAGLGVTLFVKTGGRRPALPGPLAALLEPCRPRVEVFSGRAGLYRALGRSRETRLVYSDIRADSRLTDAGKSPFSLALLEYGYAGAVETLRRMSELAEARFL